MTEQFRRSVRLQIDTLDAPTFVRGGALLSGIDVSALRIGFRVVRTPRVEPNEATISVYNLSPRTRDRISTRGIGVTLEAGYGEDLIGVFSGQIVRVSTAREGAEWVTRIEAVDGLQATEAQTDATWRAPSIVDVIKKLGGDMEVATEQALKKLREGEFKAGLKEFTKGFVAAGRTLDSLEAAAAQLGLEASIQDGTLVLLEPAEAIDGVAVRLTPETGLVESPLPGEDGRIEIRSLLNGRIIPGRRIELESEVASGSYRAARVTHDGDTHGAAWTTTAEARPL